MNKIIIETWGDFACFSRPESKVERLTYPVMTPSAARGILSAIYSKPPEFYWQICRIEVLNPIKYLSFKRNEVINSKIGRNLKPILVEDTKESGAEHRTQRQTVVLKDVRYRITAKIIPRKDYKGTVEQLYNQAVRRIQNGKCFFQPSMGMREFVCYYSEPTEMEPIKENMDLGIMLYDVFDLHKYEVTPKAEPFVSLFHAKLENGILEVPPYDSELVLKPEGGK
ncbi:type I-C CRISPR-associated protein Cas5c [uncultured Ruminococcus sp.]|uniref:type I-C CRISPR-associated protein Cas5c n=1 Tax=uncultured Ruminococcus sp. TaxID=165186 RepID=UPI0025F0EDB8|nr:type I-C CRISPR-associated protein Cas5c [uncultured Ruminococcus sp.]